MTQKIKFYLVRNYYNNTRKNYQINKPQVQAQQFRLRENRLLKPAPKIEKIEIEKVEHLEEDHFRLTKKSMKAGIHWPESVAPGQNSNLSRDQDHQNFESLGLIRTDLAVRGSLDEVEEKEGKENERKRSSRSSRSKCSNIPLRSQSFRYVTLSFPDRRPLQTVRDVYERSSGPKSWFKTRNRRGTSGKPIIWNGDFGNIQISITSRIKSGTDSIRKTSLEGKLLFWVRIHFGQKHGYDKAD